MMMKMTWWLTELPETTQSVWSLRLVRAGTLKLKTIMIEMIILRYGKHRLH